MSTEERLLNLATINIGEAITTLANIRQRGGQPGSDYAAVELSLLRAISAMKGQIWEPPGSVAV